MSFGTKWVTRTTPKGCTFNETILCSWMFGSLKVLSTMSAQLERCSMKDMFVFVFVYLEFIVPLENFSLMWRLHHYRWRAANFDRWSAHMAIEQWGFFVPAVTRVYLYNGHLRGPVPLTPVAERLTVKLSLPVFTT